MIIVKESMRYKNLKKISLTVFARRQIHIFGWTWTTGILPDKDPSYKASIVLLADIEICSLYIDNQSDLIIKLELENRLAGSVTFDKSPSSCNWSIELKPLHDVHYVVPNTGKRLSDSNMIGQFHWWTLSGNQNVMQKGDSNIRKHSDLLELPKLF